jgi:hypothetical protein
MSKTLAPLGTSDALNVIVSSKTLPLQMSFWERGWRSVRGWRRDLRSLIIKSCERVTGIDLAKNFTVIFMSLFCPFGSLASPDVAPALSNFRRFIIVLFFIVLLQFYYFTLLWFFVVVVVALWVSLVRACVSRGLSETIEATRLFHFW